ncbi:MAG: aminoacyl-tRNA hydrolase [Alphaproteobacteria bacterium]|nr:aminoacyl-tRNA hydrolase [Alphaproteobacteria bacterium]
MSNHWLIVGIGNIGLQYNQTRHNIGFDVLDDFVNSKHATFKNQKLGALAEINEPPYKYTCLKPDTFVNLSGLSFAFHFSKLKIPLENTLTIIDDLSLNIETLKLRIGGGSGGHNGLKNIEAVLKNQQYPRLRFGIGQNFQKGEQVEYVLGKWTETEKPIVDKKIKMCSNLLNDLPRLGIINTMNKYNNLKL